MTILSEKRTDFETRSVKNMRLSQEGENATTV